MYWIASNIIANTLAEQHHCPPKQERWSSRTSRTLVVHPPLDANRQLLIYREWLCCPPVGILEVLPYLRSEGGSKTVALPGLLSCTVKEDSTTSSGFYRSDLSYLQPYF